MFLWKRISYLISVDECFFGFIRLKFKLVKAEAVIREDNRFFLFNEPLVDFLVLCEYNNIVTIKLYVEVGCF